MATKKRPAKEVGRISGIKNTILTGLVQILVFVAVLPRRVVAQTADDQHDFPFRLDRLEMRQHLREAAPDVLLVQFRDLARLQC